MRKLVFPFLCLAFLVSAAAANPLPPTNGLYHSVTQGGVVLDGRFSESWVAPGGEGMLGNTLYAESWDGADLGTEWKVWCASITSPPVFVSDTRDANGTGEVTWRTTYDGGSFWFWRFGPWSSDNLLDYTGTLTSLIVTSTHEYVQNFRIGTRANITMSGIFDKLDPSWGINCMDYLITNTSIFGSTDMRPQDPDFPPFLDSGSCPAETPGLTNGAWGAVTHITLYITGCEVPVKHTTWGGIKATYGN